MSWTTITGAIAGIATIIGGIAYFVSVGVWGFKKTPEQTAAQIDEEQSKKQQQEEQSGRPQ